jgi:hypothetical protein
MQVQATIRCIDSTDSKISIECGLPFFLAMGSLFTALVRAVIAPAPSTTRLARTKGVCAVTTTLTTTTNMTHRGGYLVIA